MAIILQDYRCYRPAGKMVVTESGRRFHEPTPQIALLERCAIAFHDTTQPHQSEVPVKALLDTGADITIIKRKKLRELEKCLHPSRIPLRRRISLAGKLQPAVPLIFVFPQSDVSYVSKHGFVRLDDGQFDVGDVWLGQDILNQLVVTFNGPAGTVTIEDPNIP